MIRFQIPGLISQSAKTKQINKQINNSSKNNKFVIINENNYNTCKTFKKQIIFEILTPLLLITILLMKKKLIKTK